MVPQAPQQLAQPAVPYKIPGPRHFKGYLEDLNRFHLVTAKPKIRLTLRTAPMTVAGRFLSIAGRPRDNLTSFLNEM